MTRGRLEAFSDGVIAVIITIMVLELKAPKTHDLSALTSLWPLFASYFISFVFVGIYWSNHHHLLHAASRVNGAVLWANLHFLFWLSLTPFVTSWMGDSHFASGPVAAYGVVLLLCGCSYFILSRALIHLHGHDSTLAQALGKDRKGIASLVIYMLAIPIALTEPYYACGLYVVVAIMWLVPDRRIEKKLTGAE